MSDSDGRDFQIPEEDTIVYRLYTLDKDESILAKLAADCIQHAQSITRNHIWHYDRFSLEVVCAGKNLGERGGNSHFPTLMLHVDYIHLHFNIEPASWYSTTQVLIFPVSMAAHVFVII
jgi:hypothetical protein